MENFVLLPPQVLSPYIHNARLHSEGQIKKIIKSILEFGWTRPVLIDENKMLLAGHGRVMAAIQLGIPEIPCLIIPHLSHEEKMAYILADNALAEEANWDEEALTKELLELKDLNIDISLTGFDFDFEFEQEASQERLSSGRGAVEITPQDTSHTYLCPHCDFQFS